MMQTLQALVAHVRQTSGAARAVVWAHNSHLGDARATQMSEMGELNLGQLAREAYGAGARLIGFTTHAGTVTAASDWDEPSERKRVRPSLPGSCERLFHDVGIERFFLALGEPKTREALAAPRLERAIGVIYRPDTERLSHYFRSRVADQFDIVFHVDRTQAVAPLEPWSVDEVDLPETYPSAL
jgi:erythromycin esterase-like protein